MTQSGLPARGGGGRGRPKFVALRPDHAPASSSFLLPLTVDLVPSSLSPSLWLLLSCHCRRPRCRVVFAFTLVVLWPGVVVVSLHWLSSPPSSSSLSSCSLLTLSALILVRSPHLLLLFALLWTLCQRWLPALCWRWLLTPYSLWRPILARTAGLVISPRPKYVLLIPDFSRVPKVSLNINLRPHGCRLDLPTPTPSCFKIAIRNSTCL